MPIKVQKRAVNVTKTSHRVNIASFFSPKKVLSSTSSKKDSLTRTDGSPDGLMKNKENLHSSLESTIIPETPENVIKSHNPGSDRHDGVSCSPVSRGTSGSGSAVRSCLVARMPMHLLQNESPKAKECTSSNSDNSHATSVKRRMFSPDKPQNAKRVKRLSVKRPHSSPLKFPKSSSASGLEQYLKELHSSSTNSHITKTDFEVCPSCHDTIQITSTHHCKLKFERKDSKEQIRAEKDFSTALHAPISTPLMTVNDDSHVANTSQQKSISHNDPGLFLNEELICSFTCDVLEAKIKTMDQRDSAVPHHSKEVSGMVSQVKNESSPGKKTLERGEEEAVDDSWFDDHMELDDSETKRKVQELPKLVPDHIMLSSGFNNRYWVMNIQHPFGHSEKHLRITTSKTMEPVETCILKDGWESTPLAVGDIIHLEGECKSGTWVIDKDSGFLVLLPDVLISGTSVANSIRCMRRAVLGEIFKGFDGGSKQMLTGTIVHEIFQRAAMSMDFSEEKLKRLAEDALVNPLYLSQIYSLSLCLEEVKQGVEEYLPSLSDWARDFLASSPQAGNKLLVLKLPSDGTLSKQDCTHPVTVTDFMDIEENIWSPRFGLKGKIDVTTGVCIHRRGRRPLDRVIPLELKTGKESNSIEHRSQVILYTLMSQERRPDPEAGFLLYLKTGNMLPIVGNHMDRRELIKLRNLLAHHLGNNLEKKDGGPTCLAPLPEIISDRQACKYCPQRQNCAIYNKALERDPADPAGETPHPFLELESQHLSQPHLTYFSHWVLLCALEARSMEAKGGRRNIWLQSAQDREKTGGCVGSLSRVGKVTALAEDIHVHHFERQGTLQALAGLAVGDRVVVSDQNSNVVGIATGYVTEMSSAGVSCSLDRDLSSCHANMLFRLDQDEGAGGLGTHFGNISKLMENSPISQRLRELIVDFRPPEFIESLSSVLPRGAKDTVANILKGLNKPQKQAMKKVLLSKDYTLIVGMPGTGKTTTICTLVRILHACGFSVLLTSYTHSAVDNILLKLKKFKIGFLRLGRVQKVHPDIKPFTEEQCRSNGLATLADLENLYNKELVVATTCMGVNHAVFSRRRFDFCIVDEASQISQPVCLGPLFLAQRFVLVGDHQQLPPIVQNPEARSLGMDESLFRRLEHHSNAVIQLTVQYRMNSKIMSLSNTLMYEGKLECGSERTASAVLQLPSRDSVAQELELFIGQEEYVGWIRAALMPVNPVCFLDTNKVPAVETVEKGGISNQTEATLVHAIVSLLLKAGCKATDIGIIAPYRLQLKTISGLLANPAFSSVEVNTVDKYQGRDKSVIIVSFVRSSLEANMGELLKDWRRLNVAITRAKHKLIMIGSVSTLCRYAPLGKLLVHLEKEGMVFQLPMAAHEVLSTTFL